MVETLLEILTKRSHTFFNTVDVHSAADFINNHAEYYESGKLDFSHGRFFMWIGSKWLESMGTFF